MNPICLKDDFFMEMSKWHSYNILTEIFLDLRWFLRTKKFVVLSQLVSHFFKFHVFFFFFSRKNENIVLAWLVFDKLEIMVDIVILKSKLMINIVKVSFFSIFCYSIYCYSCLYKTIPLFRWNYNYILYRSLLLLYFFFGSNFIFWFLKVIFKHFKTIYNIINDTF